MDCFRTVLFFLVVALVSSQEANNATVYEIPPACPRQQLFVLNGSAMRGSTFTYKPKGGLGALFKTKLDKPNKNATIHYNDEENSTDISRQVWKTANGDLNFSLTGNWSSSDKGVVYYKLADGSGGSEDCNNRTATNLLVRATYTVPNDTKKNLTIQARDPNCGVKVTPAGAHVGEHPCNVTVDFGDEKYTNAWWNRNTVLTDSGPLTFRIESDCSGADVLMYYEENCGSKTSNSSQPQATKSTGQSTFSTSTTTTKSTSPTTTSATSSSSGLNVVTHALPIAFALILSTVQWY